MATVGVLMLLVLMVESKSDSHIMSAVARGDSVIDVSAQMHLTLWLKVPDGLFAAGSPCRARSCWSICAALPPHVLDQYDPRPTCFADWEKAGGLGGHPDANSRVSKEQSSKASRHLYAAQYTCVQPRTMAYQHVWNPITLLFDHRFYAPTCAPRLCHHSRVPVPMLLHAAESARLPPSVPPPRRRARMERRVRVPLRVQRRREPRSRRRLDRRREGPYVASRHVDRCLGAGVGAGRSAVCHDQRPVGQARSRRTSTSARPRRRAPPCRRPRAASAAPSAPSAHPARRAALRVRAVFSHRFPSIPSPLAHPSCATLHALRRCRTQTRPETSTTPSRCLTGPSAPMATRRASRPSLPTLARSTPSSSVP